MVDNQLPWCVESAKFSLITSSVAGATRCYVFPNHATFLLGSTKKLIERIVILSPQMIEDLCQESIRVGLKNNLQKTKEMFNSLSREKEFMICK